MNILHPKFGGGFGFSQMMSFRIRKPDFISATPTMGCICSVPDTQMQPAGVITRLHSATQLSQNCMSSAKPFDLSHAPLSTITLRPAEHEMPPFDSRYGGSVQTQSTESGCSCGNTSSASPCTSTARPSAELQYGSTEVSSWESTTTIS